MPKKRLIPPSMPAPARAKADEESMLDLSDWSSPDIEWSESNIAAIAEIEDSVTGLLWLQDAGPALASLIGIGNPDLLIDRHTLCPLCLDDTAKIDAARFPPTEAIKLSALGELVVTVRSGEPIKNDTGEFIFGKENKNIFLATHPDSREPIVLQRHRSQYRVMDRRTGKAFASPDGQIYYSVSDAKALFPEDAPHLITANALYHSRVIDKRTGKPFVALDGKNYYSVPDAKALFPDDASFLVTAHTLVNSRVMDKRTGKAFAAPDGQIYYSVPDAKALFPDDAPHLITADALSHSRVMDKRTGKAFTASDGQIYCSVTDAKAACPEDAPFRVTAQTLSQSRVMDKRTGEPFVALDGQIYYSVPDAKALFPEDAPHLVTALAFSTTKARAKKCKPADPSGSFCLTEEVGHTDDAPCPLVPAALPSSVSKKRPPPINNPLSVSKDAFFASSRENLASSRLIDTTAASKRWKPNSTGV